MSASLQPGPRDHLLTERLAQALDALSPDVIKQEPLDATEGPGRLARHLAAALLPLLTSMSLSDEQAALVNELLVSASGDAGDALVRPPMVLNDVLRDTAAKPSVRPATPFAVSDLLVNAEGQPNIGSELRAELWLLSLQIDLAVRTWFSSASGAKWAGNVCSPVSPGRRQQTAGTSRESGVQTAVERAHRA